MLQPNTKSLVLYADDDPDDLDLVRECFKSYSDSIEVLTFDNGAQVLSHLKLMKETDPLPCLIILDINMPVVNGKEALRELRSKEILDNTPIVLFTTSSNPSDREFAQAHKAGMISKPIHYHQMDLIAQKFLDHCTEAVRNQVRRHV